jgi:quercetin dioxygenase-like cupin family protein
MPIDVRRFGVGHRRPDGPPGTTGIEGQVIESGRSGTIAELAFRPRARITPHGNPNWSYFLVIEGGGWVGVGDERTRVTAGEAVVWPPDVIHAAWTDGSPMRAIVVEFTPPQLALPDVSEGTAVPIGPGEGGSASGGGSSAGRGRGTTRRVSRGEGRLAPRRPEPAEGDDAEGEPR